MGTIGRVKESVSFGSKNGSNFYYVVEKNSAQHLSASYGKGRIEVSVPQDVADQWVNSEQVGIAGEDGQVRILIEKDFVCLTPGRGEDESENFSHPKSETSC